MKKKAIIVWGNWGPYHYARYQAFREAGKQSGIEVEGIQLFPSSGIYAWSSDQRADGVHYLDLGNDEMAFRPWLLTTRLAPLIFRLKPGVVFVPSYWHWSLYLNAVSRLAGARIVMMNESHAGTERARGLKKKIKARIVASFHAALVGGTPHREFFASMGLDAEKIHLGYDAVDNDHFRAGAAAARQRAAEHRARLALPHRYVLSLGRFVEKKNLGLLVRAFGLASRNIPGTNTHLVFVGSGKKEDEIRLLCNDENLPVVDHAPDAPPPEYDESTPAAHFYGFRQVAENPVFYGLATAFVLPSLHEEWGLVVNEAMASGLPVLVSETLGCARDLVTHGENGFVFPPVSVDGLAEGLTRLLSDDGLARSMGAASSERIESWGCPRFATGALAAVDSALNAR